MLRIINVEKALSTRGYLSGIERELHLEITDDLIVENNGKFILSVSKGSGNVVKGGKGELKLDIGGLAPLYTGLFTPQQLQLAGKLNGTQAALSIATEIFTGSSPWMADFF
ncbi:MAG: sterol carrier protein domain-containing protein [Rivularia sp. (in: cyanobacteria)]